MKIKEVKIDLGNWPSSADVSPSYDESTKTLHIYKGKGRKAGAESVVLQNTKTLTIVVVGWWHKKGGGQQWYYFNPEGDRLLWSQLDKRQRRRAIWLHAHKAPSWVKEPGKLVKAGPKKWADQECWKVVVRYADGTLRSIYDPSVVYEVGATLKSRAKASHNGGLYAYPSLKETFKDDSGVDWDRVISTGAWKATAISLINSFGDKHNDQAGYMTYSRIKSVALLRCTGAGPRVCYGAKTAYSKLTIEGIVLEYDAHFTSTAGLQLQPTDNSAAYPFKYNAS